MDHSNNKGFIHTENLGTTPLYLGTTRGFKSHRPPNLLSFNYIDRGTCARQLKRTFILKDLGNTGLEVLKFKELD